MRRMFASGPDRTTKTRNGQRGLVAVLAVFFLALTLWLALHERILWSDGAPLFSIPAAFAAVFAAAAFFASDWCIGQALSLSSPSRADRRAV